MADKPFSAYYATDPLCSFCWAFEPYLLKLEFEYGHYFADTKYLMGGMIQDWQHYSANVEDPEKFAHQVAVHWRELGATSRMPISGDIWDNEPISSSIPSCLLMKLMQKRYPVLVPTFLRQLRETVLIEDKDISKDDVLIELVNRFGLDGNELVEESKSIKYEQALLEDYAYNEYFNITGFPSLIFINSQNQGIKLVGVQKYPAMIEGLTQLAGHPLEKANVPPLDQVLQLKGELFEKEIEVLYDVDPDQIAFFIQASIDETRYTVIDILGENKYIWSESYD